tara:strand:+ start:430 stop:1494 length:1065 start_codon:yes stop_codon:yes gene_type:complete
VPPAQYDRGYLSEVVRAFSVYANQMATPGPVRATSLTLTSSTGNVDQGELTWDTVDETLSVTLGDNVVQQVGFETFMRVKNNTGSLIPNGTVVGFAGAAGEIFISPYLANSASDELNFIGVTTRNVADQDTAPVTLYGRVRGLNTTGTPQGQTWLVGDDLYASPTVAGGFTKVRPTVPNSVIPVAIVVVVSATAGEIMVRPRVPIGLKYGTFSATVDQNLVSTDTATAVALGNAVLTNGTSLSNGSRMNVAVAGFYQIDASFQLSSGSAAAKTAFFWLRKNGADVAGSTRGTLIASNSGLSTLSVQHTIILQANDYLELYWAADDTNLQLDALPASAFAPTAPAVLVNVSQLQL